MVFQNWDPGNRWKEEDNKRVGVIAKIWRTEKSWLDKDLIRKGKTGFSGYRVIKRDCDRIYLVGIRSTDFAAKDLVGEKWISISILFKMRSSDFTGINSVYSLRKNLFFQYGIRRINFGLDTIGIWSSWISWVCDEQILQKTWKGGHNHGFNCNIFGINGGKSGSGEFGNCNKYKKRDQQLQRGSNVKATENKAVEAPEEGEIKAVEASNQQIPSQTFQEELAKTQAIGTEVISDPMDAESGLQVIQSLVGDSSTLNEDKVMDMDEIREVFLANGIDMDAVDELQECLEGEVEEAMRELDRAGNEDIHEDEARVTAVDGKGTTDVEMAKQHGTRKRLFKRAAGTAVSTKMRMASVRASPRKRTGVKSGMRQGENSKQMDAKGTSNTKPGLPKP
ncbi:hypothetical protein HID58_059415 [Brassica napus]|uniref:Uncharacterized protein n=1 Tax=Brassica napus TaxID=3708 RepID=A0ABQ7ZSV4_BRANA|nr:hypothetical protein HID58_059415 [Brassica napus]